MHFLSGSLRGNSVGPEGWRAIFVALRDNKDSKIESWDLFDEGIKVETAKVLAEYISVTGSLTKVRISQIHKDLNQMQITHQLQIFLNIDQILGYQKYYFH